MCTLFFWGGGSQNVYVLDTRENVDISGWPLKNVVSQIFFTKFMFFYVQNAGYFYGEYMPSELLISAKGTIQKSLLGVE